MRAIVLGVMLAFSFTCASAAVLTFEGINTASEGALLPANYGGFTWGRTYQVFTGTEWITQSAGPPNIYKNGVLMNMPNAASSPDWFLLAGGDTLGATVYAKSDTVFDFVSAYLTGPLDQLDSLLVTGLLNGAILQSSLITPATTPQQFFFNFSGIDEINFKAIPGAPLLRGPYIGIDDFTFEGGPHQPVGPPSPVPEPFSFASLVLGLGFVAGLRRRQNAGRSNLVGKADLA